MPPDESTLPPRRSRPWWRWGVAGLSALGLALSGFLSWHHLIGGSMLGCGGGSPCDDVLNSRWSTIAGVLPVSGLAAGAYLAMLVCSFSIGPANAAPVRRLAWDALLVLASAAAGSAVWFTVVQKWMIGAFCPYCMATHFTSLLLAGLVIWRASRRSDDDPPDATSPSVASSPPSVLRRLPAFAIGLALAGILAAVQVAFAPSNVSRGGESAGPLSAVDTQAVPLIGSPDARYVVTLLFDYECPHCQQLHLMLGEAIRRYHGQLAFALCPTPLNRRCNPYIPRDADEFKDSCDLTRIALAVWLADREAFSVFDNWMYSFDSGDRWRPRTLDAAKARAIELVGRAKFGTAMSDPWIDRYLQSSVRIYGETMQNGRGGVPKLVFGPRWITPQPANADELVSILQTSLIVPKP
ncbi:MAG TPA: vitamin K epoxide reductase family protein [Opitutus sp.]|nr:vitamin K epoxide reductase family protein [Opitutus sp.]